MHISCLRYHEQFGPLGKSIIDGGCGEDCHHTDSASNVELVAFASEGTEDCIIEDRHEIDSDEDWAGGETLYGNGYNDQRQGRGKGGDKGCRGGVEHRTKNLKQPQIAPLVSNQDDGNSGGQFQYAMIWINRLPIVSTHFTSPA